MSVELDRRFSLPILPEQVSSTPGVISGVDLSSLTVTVDPLSSFDVTNGYLEPIEVQSNRGFWSEMLDIFPYLRSGESPTRIHRFEIKPFEKIISSTEALHKLARTDMSPHKKIGENGPLDAAWVTEEHAHLEELNRFKTLFGRDSLISAVILHDFHPELTKATIIKLAELQGIQKNWVREEEFGKIIHEDRKEDDVQGQRLREQGWDFPYYGSVDATPLFIKAIKMVTESEPEFLQQEITGKDGRQCTIETSLMMATEWILSRVESNPEGLVENKRVNPNGIINQTWKDSLDSYSHKDGILVNPDNFVASVEVQAYTYDALLDVADLYEERNSAYAEILRNKAENLKQQVLERFWVEDERGGYFALGVERIYYEDNEYVLKPLEIRTSNMGHVLNSSLLDGDDEEVLRKKEAVITTLFADEMLNASGIRTLSKKEVRYKPGAYHNGNVWLWDTYWIAMGLERQGYKHLASYLEEEKILPSVQASGKFQEFNRGGEGESPELNEREVVIFSEFDGLHNQIEQLDQEIQAWTVAAVRAIEEKIKPGDILPEQKPLERMLLSSLTSH